MAGTTAHATHPVPNPDYTIHLQIDKLRRVALRITSNRLPIERNLEMPLPSTPMVHLKARSIIPILLHPLQLPLNRIPNRLRLRRRVALGARGSRVVLPYSAVHVSGDHRAAVDVGLAFDVHGEVVGDGDDGERGGCALADEAGGDFDVGAGGERGGDVSGVEKGVARGFVLVDCNDRCRARGNDDLLFLGGADGERLGSAEEAEDVGELETHCEEVMYSKRGILVVYCDLRGIVVEG